MPTEPFGMYTSILRRVVTDLTVVVEELGADPEDYYDQVQQHAFEYESESGVAAGTTWSSRAAIEAELAQSEVASYSALDQMIGLAHGANRLLLSDGWADDESSPPEVVRYAVALLFTRAISTTHEISALLRAGFSVGAVARWRTLYEICVVSGMLQIGNRGTAARYVNHRWVLAAKELEKGTGAIGKGGDFGPDEIRRKARTFTRRYGAEYTGTYGWAAEVTRRKIAVEKPRFYHLERLVARDLHRKTVEYAHRTIHADSLGALLMVDEEGLLHPGSSCVGIEHAAMVTIVCLGEIVDSLAAVWGNYGSCRRIALLRSLCKDVALTLQIEAAPQLRRRVAEEIAARLGSQSTPRD